MESHGSVISLNKRSGLVYRNFKTWTIVPEALAYLLLQITNMKYVISKRGCETQNTEQNILWVVVFCSKTGKQQLEELSAQATDVVKEKAPAAKVKREPQNDTP